MQDWKIQLPEIGDLIPIPERVINATLDQELAKFGLSLQGLIPKLGRPPKHPRREQSMDA